MAGPPNFLPDAERGGFDEGERASSCAGRRDKEAHDDDKDEWGLSSGKEETCGSREKRREYGGVLLQRKEAMVEESHGSRGFVAEEGGEGGSAQKKGMVEESSGSRRFLLSCTMASERVKKKRRSRATSKAPIKVFSTDTSNFMAMVHQLTGVPSNSFYTLPPPTAPSKLLPFNQGLSTLDTSAMLLPSFSCDRVSSGNSYSGLQSQPQQNFNSLCLDVQTSNQALANMDVTSLSYSDLMRSMCSADSSSLPCLWEASLIKQKSAAHKGQECCMSDREGITRQEVLHQGVTKESTLPVSGNLSRLGILLAAGDKLVSTDAWASSTSIVKSSSAKGEVS
eukprot:c21633_g1_i2 orf=386-1399(-)